MSPVSSSGWDSTRLPTPSCPRSTASVTWQACGLYLLGLAALADAFTDRLRRRFGAAGPLRYGLAVGVLALVVIFLAVALVITMPSVRRLPMSVVLAVTAGLAGLWVGIRLASARAPPE